MCVRACPYVCVCAYMYVCACVFVHTLSTSPTLCLSLSWVESVVVIVIQSVTYSSHSPAPPLPLPSTPHQWGIQTVYQEDYTSLLLATETGVEISYNYAQLESKLSMFQNYTQEAISQVSRGINTHTLMLHTHAHMHTCTHFLCEMSFSHWLRFSPCLKQFSWHC